MQRAIRSMQIVALIQQFHAPFLHLKFTSLGEASCSGMHKSNSARKISHQGIQKQLMGGTSPCLYFIIKLPDR
jgi:hypothetical protein